MSVRVKGLQEAIREIQKRGKEAEQVVKDVLEDVATDIEKNAKQDAPYDLDGMTTNARQQIYKDPFNSGLTWIIGYTRVDWGVRTNDIYAWGEFGTGLSAQQILSNPEYTSEMRDQARQFIRNRKGRIVGKPHLFPNYIRYTANLVEDLKKEIQKAIK
tara:strand:+ start:33727 stop:34200 length:474 start_codon:yes stop_codon:yes gene_type:complete